MGSVGLSPSDEPAVPPPDPPAPPSPAARVKSSRIDRVFFGASGGVFDRLVQRRPSAVAVLGLDRRIATAGRLQIKVKRRHAVAAAARPGFDALLFEELGFERLELARFHLREGAAPAVHVEALRLVPALQFQPRPRLRFVERAEFFVEALLPALVAMLVELAPDRVESRDPRQDGDKTGGAPPAPLVLDALAFRVVPGPQDPPFAAVARFQVIALKRMPRLHRRLLGFEPAAALGLMSFQRIDAVGLALRLLEILDRLAVLGDKRLRLVDARQRLDRKVPLEEGADIPGAHGAVVDQFGERVHLAVEIDQHVRAACRSPAHSRVPPAPGQRRARRRCAARRPSPV